MFVALAWCVCVCGVLVLNLLPSDRLNRCCLLSGFALSLTLPGSDGCVFDSQVSGVHWWYKSNSHGAELTAGTIPSPLSGGVSCSLRIERAWLCVASLP